MLIVLPSLRHPSTWPPPSVDFVAQECHVVFSLASNGQESKICFIWTHLLKWLTLSRLPARTISAFLFRTDDLKFSQSCMCGTKLSMFTLETRNTLVHWSGWAGQATNESQGWVNNQLPPLTLFVTTKPVNGLLLIMSILHGCLSVPGCVINIKNTESCICYLMCLCPLCQSVKLKAIGFAVQTLVNHSMTSRPGKTGNKCVYLCAHRYKHTHKHALYPYLSHVRDQSNTGCQ